MLFSLEFSFFLSLLSLTRWSSVCWPSGNSFEYHDKCQFSTREFDNDMSPRHCAKISGAPWWYNNCHDVLLTGQYGAYPGVDGRHGITWKEPWGTRKLASFAEMKIRPNPLTNLWREPTTWTDRITYWSEDMSDYVKEQCTCGCFITDGIANLKRSDSLSEWLVWSCEYPRASFRNNL